jgi:general stress protein 26
MGTNKTSRKVSELRHDPRVTLYYEAPNGIGYLVIKGIAELTDDPEMKETYWKEEWNMFYPDKESSFLLIRVIPKKLEIIDYTHEITGSSETWAVPFIEF